MDNYRLILVVSLLFVSMLLWQAWQQDYVQQPPAATQTTGTGPEIASGAAVPDAPSVASNDNPAAMLPAAQQQAGNKRIEVITDLFDMTIDTQGGTVVETRLQQYPVSVEQQDIKLRLLGSDPADFFIADSGLIASDRALAPTHESVYQAEQEKYLMADGQDELQVDLHWSNSNGVEVTKRFIFTRGSYRVGVQHLVKNGSAESWSGREYTQLQRGKPADDGGNRFMYTYTGGAIYSPENKYKKISFDDMSEKKLDKDINGGWAAMIQHYFLGAWVPPADQTYHYYTKQLTGLGRYVIGMYSPAVSVAPDTSHTFESGLVIGPKLQHQLEAIAPGLDLTVDYGWLTIIAQPMYWVLEWIHKMVGNWGWAIIFFTILLKAALYKLSETSYRSMANMRKVAPRLQALKERYGDDKQRLNQAMMEMYKTEKINPLGGCLPMLVQIPFFISLYWVLLESVELRQAPWILWIDDLSIKDPYFVLPLLMGVTMFVQQKLNPPPPDPMQAKLMMALPFVFTVFFAFFPAGLVLYWFMNNLLSIAQQWYITRKIEQAAK